MSKKVNYNCENCNKCVECENDTLLKYSDLSIEYDKIKHWKELLEQMLDIKEELNELLRDENEELKTQIKIYKEKLKNED